MTPRSFAATWLAIVVVLICCLSGCDAQPAAIDVHGATWTVHVRWWVWVPLVLWWWLRLIGRVSQ